MLSQYPQILITEFGAFKNRLACIPIYSSSSQAQYDFIVSDGERRCCLWATAISIRLHIIIGEANPRQDTPDCDI